MKTCSACKIEKSLSDFPKTKLERDGHSYRCKECSRESVRKSKAKADYREQNRRYDSKPERRAALNKRRDAHRCAHPERFSAMQEVHRALRSGNLQKQPCIVCGIDRVDAHHPDYTKPLSVVWLCRSHHMQSHAASIQL